MLDSTAAQSVDREAADDGFPVVKNYVVQAFASLTMQ